MSRLLQTLTTLSLSTVLGLGVIAEVQAITFSFDWTGQIAGWRVSGLFGYDATRSYLDGIVRTSDLDFLHVSFFTPDGTLARTYTDNHLDPWTNFNFDTQTREILQKGSFNDPDGINIGAPNYDLPTCFLSGVPSGDPTCGTDASTASGLSFWGKPPRSSVPHLHVDDWANEFGFPVGFSTHEEVAFPTRTTQELIDTNRVGSAYLPPNGSPVTPLDERGQYASVTQVPEPAACGGLLVIGLGLLATGKHRRL
jgi:PEP-CTERM motif